ncbi:MAG: glycosyltransferase family 4 protein [Anaerolineae bacterium]|nr:glycosyltransferase family 4 protein [Anaerolineae bacterium]
MKSGLITYALDRKINGIGRYTLELVRALCTSSSDFEITLLAAGGSGPVAGEDCVIASLPGCHLLPGLVTLGNLMIPSAVRRLDLDVVHDPTGVMPFLFGTAGARTVVTVHDVFAWSCPGNSTLLDTLIYRWWLPHLLPRADAVITDSHASQADIYRFFKVTPGKVHVVAAGIGAVFQPASSEQIRRVRGIYNLPDRYLLFVGSVEKRKNLRGLLHAYVHLREQDNHLPLVIVGARGPGARAIVQLVHELDLTKDVILAGYVLDSDLPALYSGADLFVFPSLYEGFGLPPLEAMACGTPVVTSSTSSLPEVAGDAAILVDPTDVEGLADAMQRVLADRDLQMDLRQRGLKRAAEFTWERTACETVHLYREVLSL